MNGRNCARCEKGIHAMDDGAEIEGEILCPTCRVHAVCSVCGRWIQAIDRGKDCLCPRCRPEGGSDR